MTTLTIYCNDIPSTRVPNIISVAKKLEQSVFSMLEEEIEKDLEVPDIAFIYKYLAIHSLLKYYQCYRKEGYASAYAEWQIAQKEAEKAYKEEHFI